MIIGGAIFALGLYLAFEKSSERPPMRRLGMGLVIIGVAVLALAMIE